MSKGRVGRSARVDADWVLAVNGSPCRTGRAARSGRTILIISSGTLFIDMKHVLKVSSIVSSVEHGVAGLRFRGKQLWRSLSSASTRAGFHPLSRKLCVTLVAVMMSISVVSNSRVQEVNDGQPVDGTRSNSMRLFLLVCDPLPDRPSTDISALTRDEST